LDRVIDYKEETLIPIQIKRRTFGRFKKHYKMLRLVNDDIVSYNQILESWILMKNTMKYTYEYGLSF